MAKNGQFVPVGEIDRRIREIEEQLARLPVELEVLRRLRTEAIDVAGLAEPPPGESTMRRVGPSQAILRHLAKTRTPIRTAELIAAVEAVVDSSAADIRRSLYSTISNLKKHQSITVVDGFVEITEAGLKATRG